MRSGCRARRARGRGVQARQPRQGDEPERSGHELGPAGCRPPGCRGPASAPPRAGDARSRRPARPSPGAGSGRDRARRNFARKARHVDLDRALAGARLAGEAAVHRLLDLVREVVAPRRLPIVFAIRAGSVRHAGVARSLAASATGSAPSATISRSHSRISRGPALGRVPALARPLPGRAHRGVEVEVVAGAVAVAVERVVVALPDAGRDRALAAAAGRDLVDPQQLPSAGAAILPGLSWSWGSKAALICCRHG